MIFGKITTMWDAFVKKTRIVVNYGDFICVTYILFVGLLEHFKFQLGYKLD
jgi:hypothetical protein